MTEITVPTETSDINNRLVLKLQLYNLLDYLRAQYVMEITANVVAKNIYRSQDKEKSEWFNAILDMKMFGKSSNIFGNLAKFIQTVYSVFDNQVKDGAIDDEFCREGARIIYEKQLS